MSTGSGKCSRPGCGHGFFRVTFLTGDYYLQCLKCGDYFLTESLPKGIEWIDGDASPCVVMDDEN